MKTFWSDFFIDMEKQPIRENNPLRARKITCITNGRTYDSVNEASLSTGLSVHTIRLCAGGVKKYGGIWNAETKQYGRHRQHFGVGELAPGWERAVWRWVD